jgi:threonine 3-dehydrogenase
MPSLITGGSGIIGSEIAHRLTEAGEEVVLFSRTSKTERIEDIRDKVKWVRGDLGIAAHVFNAIKDNKISDVYHLGAMLTFASEDDPHESFQTNVLGTMHLLEAARLFGVRRVMFASSIGTYGLEIGETVSDQTIQRPASFYGICKLYCEGLGRYYRNRYSLDFRCIRYPAVVAPGVRTPGHWIPPMIEDSVLGKPHDSLVSGDATAWILSLKDAAKAACQILKAPKENIKMVNYNVAGCIPAVKAEEIAATITKLNSTAVIRFRQDKNGLRTFRRYSGNFDDSCARREWGWKPDHDTIDRIVQSFIIDLQRNLNWKDR